MMELATKTKTADNRIASQRAVRGTMCSLLRAQGRRSRLSTRGYDRRQAGVNSE
jgi:hypothetical protein